MANAAPQHEELHEDDIQLPTMVGDLTEIIRDEINALPDVWQKLSKDQQDEVLERVHRRVKYTVARCAVLLHELGDLKVSAILDKITIKDDVQIVLHTARSHDLLALSDHVNQQVYVSVIDPEEYGAGESPPEGEEDQRSLELQAEQEAQTREGWGG